MLIVNDEQRLRAGIESLSKRCPCCRKALAAYPLILSDDAGLVVYHAAFAAAILSAPWQVLWNASLLLGLCGLGERYTLLSYYGGCASRLIIHRTRRRGASASRPSCTGTVRYRFGDGAAPVHRHPQRLG